MIQAPPDKLDLTVDQVAEAATRMVMARLERVVRKTVDEQIEGQRRQLDKLRASPLPPHALVAAAAKVATAALKLENDKFSRGERSARAALDSAIDELRSAYRAYSAIHHPKGL